MKLFDLIRMRYLYDRSKSLLLDAMQACAYKHKSMKAKTMAASISQDKYDEFVVGLFKKYNIDNSDDLITHFRSFTGYRIVRFMFQLLGMGHYV